MNNTGMFRIELDDYALPAFSSGSKYYFGTLEQIGEWISAIKADEQMASEFETLIETYHTFYDGDLYVTHNVAHRNVPFLKPAKILHKEHVHVGRYDWMHINIRGFPYYLKCDGFETTHLWLKCGKKYYRYLFAEIKNLRLKNAVGEWDALGMYWGFPKILVEEDGITRNRLAEWEKSFKTLDDARDDWETFPLLKETDFCEFFNDIFGDS